MENVIDRLNALETRSRKIEGQLRRWRLAAALLALIVVSLGVVLPGEAQGPTGAGTTVNAPFTVKGSDGRALLTITEFADAERKSKDTLLTVYRDGQPAALFRTTGMLYQDAADPKANFLNVYETWLYRYDDKAAPVAYLATSTALTRSGGSLVVFNEQGKPSTHPPFAARLAATPTGGRLTLYTGDGKEGKTIEGK